MITLQALQMLATATFDSKSCTIAGGGTPKVGTTDTGVCDTNLPTSQATSGQLHTLLQVAIGIIAVVAVLMIIISAMNILYSEGDPQKASKARSSIIYALVGLIVAVTAEVIVTFVVGEF